MKHLLADVLKVGATLKELVLAPTPRGHLHTLVRISRPNWSVQQCFRAGRWIRRNGLMPRSSFADTEQYLVHIQKQLATYDTAHPVKGQYEVADELSLSRWEGRWSRARTRQKPGSSTNLPTAAQVSSAA